MSRLCQRCGVAPAEVTHVCPPVGVYAAPVVQRAPTICPVCLGKTTMPSGFYADDATSNALPVKCRSCGGKGIV